MPTLEEVREFLQVSLDDILDVPHTIAMSPSELLGLLGAIDATQRFIQNSSYKDAWFELNRRLEKAGVVDKDLVNHTAKMLKLKLDRDPTKREQMAAICQFWKVHMKD